MTEPAKTPIKRYDIWVDETDSLVETQSDDGEWCDFDDVAPLLQRIAELEAANVWLDKPDKPGWWLAKDARLGADNTQYYAKYVRESDLNWSGRDAAYPCHEWRFISE